jgi:hypothetical protein
VESGLIKEGDGVKTYSNFREEKFFSNKVDKILEKNLDILIYLSII